MVPERIEREIDIAAPVEKVWSAVTEAEHLAAWFGDAGAEIDLRPGGRIAWSWKEHGTSLGVVEKVEPTSYFSYRWAGSLGGEPVEGNSTLVEFILAPAGEGTRLRVVESGFRDLAQSDDVRRSCAEGNTEGWRLELDELREYVER